MSEPTERDILDFERMMHAFQRFLIWLVWDGPYLGPLAPWLFGLAIGKRPVAKRDSAIDEQVTP